jgi:hypothetical protein
MARLIMHTCLFILVRDSFLVVQVRDWDFFPLCQTCLCSFYFVQMGLCARARIFNGIAPQCLNC